MVVRFHRKPWMIPAALSGGGFTLLVAALSIITTGLATGHLGWISCGLYVAFLVTGAPLALAALFVPVEGPFWRKRT